VKTLEDQMSVYAAYHQDARNKATHFVGVPVIVFSLMIPLGWLRVDLGGFVLSAAMVVTSILLLYYLVLDVPLGLAMAASPRWWTTCSRSSLRRFFSPPNCSSR
jgi:uncharacterized membrane protein YGL010W